MMTERFVNGLTKGLSILLVFTMGVVVGFNYPADTPEPTRIVPVYIIERFPPVEPVEEHFQKGEEPVAKVEPVEKITVKNSARKVSESEFDLLTRLVTAEAKGESIEGMVAVANVVLNRVDSPKWDDTIHEVIQAPRQFQPVSSGTIGQPATEQSVKAVLRALEGEQVVPQYVDSFAHHSVDFSSWATLFTQIGNHKFWTSNGGA